MSESQYTIEQYQALKAAIAEGAKVVRYQDKWLEYRSLKEMNEILRAMAQELGLNKTKSRRLYASFSDGTD